MPSNMLLLTIGVDKNVGEVSLLWNAKSADDLRALYDAVQIASKAIVDAMLPTPSEPVQE
jgi:hypothetical protein